MRVDVLRRDQLAQQLADRINNAASPQQKENFLDAFEGCARYVVQTIDKVGELFKLGVSNWQRPSDSPDNYVLFWGGGGREVKFGLVERVQFLLD